MSNKYPGVEVLPTEVDDEEQLARCIFDKEIADSRRITLRDFIPPPKEKGSPERIRDISVDRFDYLMMGKAVQLGDIRAETRPRPFVGWAIMFAARARRTDGVEVVSSPPCDGSNPAHADIVLPKLTTTEQQARQERLKDLAEGACWLPRSVPATRS